ncbi:MAG: protease inhibitor I42 family protein [Candidatus Tantalella remota]|nr:protease inhibitor I42 family protein [Candidatus Tantalella remota]
MMRKSAGILAIMVFVILAGCVSHQPVRVRLYEDMAVEVGKEQVLEVELDANPTTGYAWQVEVSPAYGSVLQVGEGKYEPLSDRVGSGGTIVYNFAGAREGQSVLTFKYLRPWEKGIAPVKMRTLTVTVK